MRILVEFDINPLSMSPEELSMFEHSIRDSVGRHGVATLSLLGFGHDIKILQARHLADIR